MTFNNDLNIGANSAARGLVKENNKAGDENGIIKTAPEGTNENKEQMVVTVQSQLNPYLSGIQEQRTNNENPASSIPSFKTTEETHSLSPTAPSTPQQTKSRASKRISPEMRGKLRGEFPLGKRDYETVPSGFTKFLKPFNTSIFVCNRCFAKVRSIYIPHHIGLHNYAEKSWSSICPKCFIFIRTDDLPKHLEKDCLKKNKATPVPNSTLKRKRQDVEVVDIEEEENGDYYKCKTCRALIKPGGDDLAWHLQLHEKGTSSRNICTEPDCGWLTANVAQHKIQWHSRWMNANAWAHGSNFWVVDGSNPSYNLFRQEYVSKFLCKRCPAQYFKREEMEEHLKCHESVKQAEVYCLRNLRIVDEGEYCKCHKCEAKCLEADKLLHIQLHNSKCRVRCNECGLLLKPGTLSRHKNYFH